MELTLAVLGLPCDPVGQSWELLGALLGRIEARLDRFGALLDGLEPLWPSGGSFGAVVGLCRACWTRPPFWTSSPASLLGPPPSSFLPPPSSFLVQNTTEPYQTVLGILPRLAVPGSTVFTPQ